MKVTIHSTSSDDEVREFDEVPRKDEYIQHDRGNGARSVKVGDVIWDMNGHAHIYVWG